MRAINILIIIVAMVLSFVFSNAEAEAAGRNNRTCICTSANGTLYQNCRVHGNSCIGFGQHAHDNMRGRQTNLPIFCNINGQTGLYQGATNCQQVRQYVRNQQRAIRDHQREQRRVMREQQREERRIQNAFRNNPFSRELRRGANDAMRRSARDLSRDIFGR